MKKPEIGQTVLFSINETDTALATVKGILEGENYQNNEVNLVYHIQKFTVPANAVPYSRISLENTWRHVDE